MSRCRTCALIFGGAHLCPEHKSLGIRRTPVNLAAALNQGDPAPAPAPNSILYLEGLPPQRLPVSYQSLFRSIPCANCKSPYTKLISTGGTLSGRKVYQCNSCQQYFYVYYPVVQK